MLKKNIKPVLLAGALALATAVSPVVAEEDEPTVNPNPPVEETPVYSTDDDNPKTIYSDEFVISKTLSFASGITKIDDEISFTFNIEGERVNDEDEDEVEYVSGAPTATIDYGTNDDETIKTSVDFSNRDTGNAISLQDETAKVKFNVNEYTVPGIYNFYLTENVVEGDTNITYSRARYEIKVRVINIDPNNPGEVEINAITIRKTDSQEKSDNAAFTNYYTEDNSGKLTVSKTITGTDADSDDAFAYTITFNTPSNALETKYDYQIASNDKVMNVDASYESTDEKTDGAKTLEFTLHGGESAVFEKLPAGTTYTVTEKETELNGYALSGITGTNGSVKTDDKYSFDGTLFDTGNDTVTFTNNKDSNPITGVIVNNMPYIALLGASGAGLVVLAASKKRSK